MHEASLFAADAALPLMVLAAKRHAFIAAESASPILPRGRGNVQMTRDELLAIKAQAEKLTRDDPSSADAWRNLAQAKMMLGDFDGAIDDCIECLRLSPTDEYGLILLGNIYVNGKKDVATGLNYYKKAAEANPKSVLAECNIGASLARSGKNLEAVPHFRRALELDRKNGLSYFNLAQCYQAMEDWHSAWLVANDALQFGELAYENSQMRDQVCSRLRYILQESIAHGGNLPPQNGEKALERALRQLAFERTHETPDGPRDTMMAMYMLGAMEQFDKLPPEKVKAIAIEIAMFGTNGIAPDREYEKPLKNLPEESFTGNRLLAWYYVSWKYAFPDQLHLVGLPFDSAYELAMTLRGAKGE